MSNAIKIRNAARARGITALFHFTPMANLESIFINGLISRCLLDEHEVRYFYSDGWRNDGQPDAVSLSIHDINRSMFAHKLRLSRCAWAILEVDASVLWTHPCRFCWVNAASSEIVNHTGFIGGPWAFNRMFHDRAVSIIDKRSSREAFETPDNKPTTSDAEVQVLAPIDPDLIRDVTVAHQTHRAAAKAAMKAAGRVLPIEVYPDIFT